MRWRPVFQCGDDQMYAQWLFPIPNPFGEGFRYLLITWTWPPSLAWLRI